MGHVGALCESGQTALRAEVLTHALDPAGMNGEQQHATFARPCPCAIATATFTGEREILQDSGGEPRVRVCRACVRVLSRLPMTRRSSAGRFAFASYMCGARWLSSRLSELSYVCHAAGK